MQAIYVTELKSTCLIASKRSYIGYLPAIILSVVVAVLSLWENPEMPASVPMNDKWLHGLMYTLLAVVWMVPSSRQFSEVSIPIRTRVLYYIYVCAGVTFYGGLMEVLQRYCTVTRSGEMADLYADGIGAVIGVAIVYLFRKKQ